MSNLVKFILYHVKISPKLSPKETHEAVLNLIKAMADSGSPQGNKRSKRKGYNPKKRDPDFSLQDVFEALARDYHFASEEIAGRCVDLMQSLANLSEDLRGDDWSFVARHPIYTLYGLLHYIDYFWWDAKRKEQVAALLRWFLESRVKRKLTKEEVQELASELRDSFPVDKRGISTVSFYLFILVHSSTF